MTRYSVEYLPKHDIHNCWNQHILTKGWLRSRIYLYEAKRTHGRGNEYRIRSFEDA